MHLRGNIVRAPDVASADRDAMFALMDRHYDNIDRDTFESDLAEKDWIIRINDPDTGALVGFSTQVLLSAQVNGRPITALFSGDTVVAREHWGDSALARIWGRHALELIDADPERELYWFLIAKGYKTFRFLPLFFREFGPHPDRPITIAARTIRDTLGRLKFPHSYDEDRGIVVAGPTSDRLRPGIADITPERTRDRFVRFFAEHNPGHIRGDELACLAPLTRENFTAAAYRVIGTTLNVSGVV
jgi:hypothetical protein